MSLVAGAFPKLPPVPVGENGERLEDYPFSPEHAARYRELDGLDKLRAIEDPKLREAAWRAYWYGRRNRERLEREEREQKQLDEERTRKRRRREVVAVLAGREGTKTEKKLLEGKLPVGHQGAGDLTEHLVEQLHRELVGWRRRQRDPKASRPASKPTRVGK